MSIDTKILERLTELVLTGEEVIKTERRTDSGFHLVNSELSVQWRVNSLNIIGRVFGENSQHFKMLEKFSDHSSTSQVKNAVAVVRAAKDDYENGYLFDTKALIEAEVFDEFLEQAEELFEKGYYQAAAVITGCVLEDGLRKLCDRDSITLPAKATIEPMNVELAKAGIYNKLIQKKITALADLRNKAAHGEWSEFSERDVEEMIRDVRRFMEDYFS